MVLNVHCVQSTRREYFDKKIKPDGLREKAQVLPKVKGVVCQKDDDNDACIVYESQFSPYLNLQGEKEEEQGE